MPSEGSIIEEIKLWFQKALGVLSSFKFSHLIDLLLIAFVAAVAGLITEKTFKNKLVGSVGFSLCLVYLCYLRFFKGQQWIVPIALLVLGLSFMVALLGKVAQWLTKHRQRRGEYYNRWR